MKMRFIGFPMEYIFSKFRREDEQNNKNGKERDCEKTFTHGFTIVNV